MTLRTVRDTRLWVEDTGGDLPPVLFAHGVLWNTSLFAPQVAALRDHYRCISYDHRGQGRSDDAEAKSVPIEQVYEDAVALIESLDIGPVHLVGLSMGGFVAMRVAARRPDLLRSLTLLDTACTAETAINLPKYWGLNFIAQLFGIASVIDPVMQSLFGKTVLTDPARAADVAAWRTTLLGNRRTVVRAMRGVMSRKSVVSEMSRITVPTLIMVGEEDRATPPAKSEQLHALIRGSSFVRVPLAGHSAPVEQPAFVSAALDSFLSQHR
jgi:pimeloyl-ACP methyl ester carboxylesterase